MAVSVFYCVGGYVGLLVWSLLCNLVLYDSEGIVVIVVVIGVAVGVVAIIAGGDVVVDYFTANN